MNIVNVVDSPGPVLEILEPPITGMGDSNEKLMPTADYNPTTQENTFQHAQEVSNLLDDVIGINTPKVEH